MDEVDRALAVYESSRVIVKDWFKLQLYWLQIILN